MKNMKIVTALGLMVSSMSLAATTPGASFAVTANVAATCSTTTPATLGFGNYDVYAVAATTNTTSFSVKCSKGTAYTMKLSGGDTSGVRAFTGGDSTGTLSYSLAFESTPWGDGASGHAAAVQKTSASKDAAPYTINGSIAAGQDVANGAYTDNVTLTVDY